MSPEELRERTFEFALLVYTFARPLLREADTKHVAQQLIRAATSVAANYRAACLARSPAEWLAKIGVVREESDETLFWLVFTRRIGVAAHRSAELDRLIRECDELTRIFAASHRTGRQRRSGTRSPNCPIAR